MTSIDRFQKPKLLERKFGPPSELGGAGYRSTEPQHMLLSHAIQFGLMSTLRDEVSICRSAGICVAPASRLDRMGGKPTFAAVFTNGGYAQKADQHSSAIGPKVRIAVTDHPLRHVRYPFPQ